MHHLRCLLALSLSAIFLSCSEQLAAQSADEPAVKGSPSSDTPGLTTPAPESPAVPGAIDACALLTHEEIESIQHAAVRDTKGSSKLEGGMAVSSCFITLPEAPDSISLAVWSNAKTPDGRSPKEAWERIFDNEDKKPGGEREEGEKERARPEPLPGLGDEAFWVGQPFGGALYVLKGESYLRIGIGSGKRDHDAQVATAKSLAEFALKRM